MTDEPPSGPPTLLARTKFCSQCDCISRLFGRQLTSGLKRLKVSEDLGLLRRGQIGIASVRAAAWNTRVYTAYNDRKCK